jgi:hypothetical protein
MIVTEAVILNQISTSTSIVATVVSMVSIPDTISTTATLTNLITSCAVITDTIESCAVILNTGLNDIACPIILCIDGGVASTVSYPAVNGLLNGGSA